MDAGVLNVWLIGVGVGVVVVLAAAALLLLVLREARNIERDAAVALDVVTQIRESTNVIWALEDTNRVARQLHGGAQSILAHAGAVAEALHEADLRREKE